MNLRAALLPAALLLLAAAPSAPHLLREQAWTLVDDTSGPDLAYALTHAPAECLGLLIGHQIAPAEAGRALFRSPLLLGGPSARLGLSCNACHTNGRSNTRFFLPELTDRTGAADVTSEWSSHVRGDGLLNPVDVPDLAGVAERASFGRARDPSLRHFVHGVIVEEFQGAEPPERAMMSLMSYLGALSTEHCATDDDVPITLESAARDVRRALDNSWQSRDWPTQRMVIGAAQDAVGRIVERLPPRDFRRERRQLEELSRQLTAVRNGPSVAAWAVTRDGWYARFDAVIARIARRERRTYFNEATLRAALQR